MSLKSFGLKRYLASALTALAGIIAVNPSTAYLLPVVGGLASLLGLIGLVHAGKDGTLLEKPHLSIAALFPLLISASEHIPALAPYHSTLLLIGSVLGLSAIAAGPIPAAPASVKIISKKK